MSIGYALFKLRRRAWCLLWTITGGRPMFRGKPLFRDVVSGRTVYHYTDRLGRDWMANRGLSLFRVERNR